MKARLQIELNRATQLDELVNLDEVRSLFDDVGHEVDGVSYGFDQVLIAGLVFLFEASTSGIAWDLIKSAVVKTYLSIRPPDNKPVQALVEIHLAVSDAKLDVVFTVTDKDLGDLYQHLEKFETKVVDILAGSSRPAADLAFVVRDGEVVPDPSLHAEQRSREI